MTVFRVVAASATVGASAGSSACSRMGPSSPHAALRANRPPSSGRYSRPAPACALNRAPASAACRKTRVSSRVPRRLPPAAKTARMERTSTARAAAARDWAMPRAASRRMAAAPAGTATIAGINRAASPDTIPRATSPATISSPAPACSPVISGIRSLQNRGYSLHAPSPRALHLPAHGARWHPGRQGAAGSRRDPKLGGGKLEMDLNERQEPSKIVVPSTHKPRVLIHIAKEE